MNSTEAALFLAFVLFYLVAFGLYQLMVFKLNRFRRPDSKIPHRLFWGGWKLVETEYKTAYPKSSVYQLSLSSAVSALVIGLGLAVLRIWEYMH